MITFFYTKKINIFNYLKNILLRRHIHKATYNNIFLDIFIKRFINIKLGNDYYKCKVNDTSSRFSFMISNYIGYDFKDLLYLFASKEEKQYKISLYEYVNNFYDVSDIFNHLKIYPNQNFSKASKFPFTLLNQQKFISYDLSLVKYNNNLQSCIINFDVKYFCDNINYANNISVNMLIGFLPSLRN